MKDIITKIPILKWRGYYNKSFLRPDIIAGVTMGSFLIPQSIAFASLASLPPQSGLYAVLVSSIIYFLFGFSRQLSVNPTSALAILVGSTIGTLTITSPSNLIAMGAFVALIAGILAVIARILKMGFIVKFISTTVLTGFSTGTALYIAASQINKLFGISGDSGGFFNRIIYLFSHINEMHLITLIIGILAILFLYFSKKYIPRLPNALILVIATVCLFSLPHFQHLGVSLVGFIPTGLPYPSIPNIPSDYLITLLSLGFAVFILSNAEGMGAVETFAWRNHNKVDTNQEFLANGIANITAGLFQGMPVGGSMSASSVNSQSGAKSPFSSGIAGIVLFIVILFIAGYFSVLPKSVLAAVVIIAVMDLVNFKAIKKYYRVSKYEFTYALITMFSVLLFGVLNGLLIGILVSFMGIIIQLYYPDIPELGPIKGTNLYKRLDRGYDNERIPEILIFRVDSSQFFINAENIRDNIIERVDKFNQENPDNKAKLIIMDMENTNKMDITAAEKIQELGFRFKENNISIKLANLMIPSK